MIDVAVAGASGYAGVELVRLLVAHPKVKTVIAGSRTHVGTQLSTLYPHLRGFYDQQCVDSDLATLADQSDLLFLALPHGVASGQINAEILQKCVVIDLSADFRLQDPQVYEQWYKTPHHAHSLLEQAVYGLSELYRQEITSANLIANPGCYTTCSILTLAPLVRHQLLEEDSIIIDAKSGVTGAGRKVTVSSLYSECNESLKAYGVASHRHTPEIEQELSLASSGGKATDALQVQFTPHLVPMNRGILATCYAKLRSGVSATEIAQAYQEAYQAEPFVRVLGENILPNTSLVKGTNLCDIGFTLDRRTKRLIAIGAIDNLVKGAAGQAVQNMNIRFGYQETMGLEALPAFPV